MFLSLKFHRLRPQYMHERIKALNRAFRTFLLCHCDVEDPINPLAEVSQGAIDLNVTLVVAFSDAECARYLELLKAYENKAADALKPQAETDYVARYAPLRPAADLLPRQHTPADHAHGPRCRDQRASALQAPSPDQRPRGPRTHPSPCVHALRSCRACLCTCAAVLPVPPPALSASVENAPPAMVSATGVHSALTQLQDLQRRDRTIPPQAVPERVFRMDASLSFVGNMMRPDVRCVA